MVAESKGLLEERQKRTAPNTKARPSKQQKRLKHTALHPKLHNDLKHQSTSPLVEDDPEEDEPLINRLMITIQPHKVANHFHMIRNHLDKVTNHLNTIMNCLHKIARYLHKTYSHSKINTHVLHL
ncbi:hypothetical protein BG005_001252 [Podila minutissima]|nr:hypothetical protein BG005_001252 [Podila minutissima]